MPWTIPGHGGDKQFVAIKRKYNNSTGSSQGWEMGLDGVSQHRPSLKSKHSVCVVQYELWLRAGYNAEVKSTPLCAIYSIVLCWEVFTDREVFVTHCSYRVSWVLSFRLKDGGTSPAQGWTTFCELQGKAEPSCLSTPITTTGTEINAGERRGVWDPENKEK